MASPSPWPRDQKSRMWRSFVISGLAAGASDSVNVMPQIPDRWIVSIVPAAAVRLNVYLGPSPSGDFIPLGGGGKCTIPSDLASLSFKNAGANPITFVIVAVRNYDYMDIDCGELV